MKNRIIMIILLGIILSGTTLIAANTRKKSNKKRREPQTTKIKYKEVVDAKPMITFVKAEEIALAHAGLTKDDANVSKILMEQKDKELTYKIVLNSDTNDYNYIVGSNEGKILNYSLRSRDYLNSNANYIGNDKVKEIILNKMPEVTEEEIYEIKIDKENNLPVYKVRVISKGKDYKFTLNAFKGDITKSEETDFTAF